MIDKRCEEIPTHERNFDNTGKAVYRVGHWENISSCFCINLNARQHHLLFSFLCCEFLSARSICECHIIYRAAIKECRILDQSCQWPFAMTRLTQYRRYDTLNFQLTYRSTTFFYKHLAKSRYCTTDITANARMSKMSQNMQKMQNMHTYIHRATFLVAVSTSNQLRPCP